jgi:hypothetical protein
MKDKWIQEPVVTLELVSKSCTPNTPKEVWEECDSWADIRGDVRFRFFRKGKNVRLWHHTPIADMKDRSQSGYEWQLAIRWMHVGATDQEVLTVYPYWCHKNGLKPQVGRFRRTVSRARKFVADYIARWQAGQPVRRKHGTTTKQIVEAIRNGASQPKAIVAVTGLKGSAIRMHLKRLTDSGKLVCTPSGYAIADDYKPYSESLAA